MTLGSRRGVRAAAGLPVFFAAVLLLLPSATRASDANLDIELTGDAYRSGSDAFPSAQGWATVAPRWSAPAGPAVFSIRALAEADTHGEISRHHLYDDEDRELRRSILRFEELSVRADLGDWDVEAGRQRLAWGRTDIVNPTDNLTPRDWTDPLDEQRLSPWALRVNYEKSRWSGELAVIPRFAPSRLPLLGERWFAPEEEAIPNPAFPAFGPKRLRLTFDWDETDFPATRWSNAQAALRGGRRGVRTEWSLSYYRGFDDAPRITAQPAAPDLAQGIQPVLLERRFAALDVAGGDLVFLAGKWAVRGEAGYFHYTEGLDDGFLLYDAELEWTHEDWSVIVGGADSIAEDGSGASFSGAGTGAAVGPSAPTDSTGVSTSLDQAFLPAGFLRVARVAATEWDASLEAVVGLRETERLIRAAASFPLSDRVRAGGEAALLAGSEDTLFGSWRENDRIRVFIRVSL